MKKPIPAPTADEMLAAIDKALGPDPSDDGVTAAEYAAKFNPPLSRDAARTRLEGGVRDGKLLRGQAMRRRDDGRRGVQTVYRPAG